MKLSIVIVNYNVKHFLHQCLTSVFNALKKTEAEVWVVDNNSVDGSNEMVKELFPKVKLVANKDNVGFSKANNQAIRESKGEYVLLLNPDTIVEETTFEKIVNFMDKHPNAGGLGVNMIDGKGHFLPESKRGIPTPEVAFYKMFGLTNIFPKSKKFAKYYVGHLDKNETNKVEILSGAFMLLRKTVLDEIGLLDEDFFMYGEDIDLSYRILKAGYDNYYFADTTIVHYKGESTKKGSLNYVYVFYNAMIIFAKKHFAQNNAKLFMFLIKIAIIFRAFISIIRRIFNSLYIPLTDFVAIFIGFYVFVPIWEKFHFETANEYPYYIWYIIPVYIFIWLISSFYSGAYDKPLKIKSIFNGILIGTAIILVFYALIDSKLRFSRALILIGASYSIVIMFLIRMCLFVFKKYTKFSFYFVQNTRIVIVGNLDEAKRVSSILDQISLNKIIVGVINPDNLENGYIGRLDQIDEIVKIHKINEVIFCGKNLSNELIISKMLRLSSLNVSVKIAPEESFSIIGSNSINTAGDLYTLDLNVITKPDNVRYKNLTDKILSIIFLITYPINFIFVKNKIRFLYNIFLVFFGNKSWVGFYKNNKNSNLPSIKKGILNPLDTIRKNSEIDENLKNNLNISYAKNYKVSTDLYIILVAFRELGRKE